jgi:hypothetical protein
MNEELSNLCKNCGHGTQGDYCSACGQRTSINKVTFKETFQDLIDAIFSVNAPLFITFKMLLVNPGRIFTEYLNGKRKKYYRPVTFFILMTVIYLVIRELINYDPFGSTLLKVEDPYDSQILTKTRNFMLLNIDKFLFAFVFSLGLMMKLFFYKKHSLAEFLSISFYLIGIYTILTTLNMFYIQYLDKTFQGIHIVVMFLYFIYAMASFFKKNRWWVIVKSIFIYALGFYFYGFLAFGLSFILVWVNNQ